MTRKNKLFLNTSMAILNQVVTFACGIILPRLFISHYGSAVNGLIASIVQFLTIIAFLELGVGAVVKSSLYKPLAENDYEDISRIFVSAKKFFRKIAGLLLIYSILLMVLYPLSVSNSFDYFYTASLIFIISIGFFVEYYFGIVYQLLLNADQMSFVQLIMQSGTLILNTVITIFLIKMEVSVQLVKLVSSLIFLMRPIVYFKVVNKYYKLDAHIVFFEEPIKQKWNGVAQHVAYVILDSTDIIILTMFSTLGNISVYAVYYLVVNGVKQLIVACTFGITALFGNMLAKNEKELLNKFFSQFEWFMHVFIVIVFSCTGLLIIPFIRIYTKDITDQNYIVPLFAYLLTLSKAIYCLELPYNMMVLAAGHYKRTQNSSIIETILNVVISLLFVSKFGLVGVAIGTLVAMLYRTTYLAWYLTKNILSRSFNCFMTHILVDIVTVLVVVVSTNWIKLAEVSFASWISMAFKVFGISLVESIVINLIFYRDLFAPVLGRLRSKLVQKI
jgi:O-antigen/teichoic acid export membrane protein